MKNTKTDNTENRPASCKLSDASTCSVGYRLYTFQMADGRRPINADKSTQWNSNRSRCIEAGKAWGAENLITQIDQGEGVPIITLTTPLSNL